MKTIFCVALLCGATSFAADVLTEKLQRGLFEEEANRNLDAAIKEYQSVVTQSDEQRKVIATALFRLGECYRKLGKTNEANAQYARILRDFSEQEQLVKLSRDVLGLKANAVPGAPDAGTMTQAEAEELVRVKSLAKNSPDLLNTVYKGGLTPLQSAAWEGYPTVLEFILTQGVDVNGPERQAPPLMLAADRGHLRIVEMLLNRGADVNAAGTSGKTALIAAVEKNFKAVAELLLRHGADVNRATVGNSTALHSAVAQGSSNLIALLLAQKANPNVLTKPSGSYGGPQPTIERSDFDSRYGATPLHLAARQGYAVIASLLLKSGALVNSTNWAGATPLHIAVAVPHTNVMHLLLASGADPNVREHSAGATPVALAIQKNAEITKALLAAGAKVNEPAYERPDWVAYPLHLAASSQDADVLGALLAAKPNLEVTNLQGHTPLWTTLIDSYRTNNLQMLIDAGADIRHVVGGYSPLQSARNGASASLLLKAGADPNRVFDDGDTLLHRYSRFPNTAMLRVLLERGANPNIFNNRQETPYSIAESGAEGRITSGSNERERQASREEWRRISQLLSEYGADKFMQRRLHINARRGANGFSVFSRGTNELNRFTLMELLGHVYQNGGSGYPGGSLLWPDFSNLRIHRVGETNESVVSVDLANALKNGECSADRWLQWGDEVEIPERVHPLNSYWPAVSEDEAATLTNCAARTIEVHVSGTTMSVKLQPYMRAGQNPNQPAFQQPYYVFAYLPIVVRNEPLVNRELRATSNLTRVTVRRTDPQTKEVRTMTFDTTDVAIPNSTSGSIPLEHSLWLRDGDVIEIPEKQ